MRFDEWVLGIFIFTVCVGVMLLILISSPQKAHADALPVTGIVSNEPLLDQWIEALCEDRGIPPEIVFAIIERESGCDPSAVNEETGAAGLMQIVPGTWTAQTAAIRVEMGRDVYLDPLDPFDNVFVGVWLLAYLMEGRDIELALDCYALGEGGAAERMVAMERYEPTGWTQAVLARAAELEKEWPDKGNLGESPYKQEV